jgi:hypothetical protein
VHLLVKERGNSKQSTESCDVLSQISLSEVLTPLKDFSDLFVFLSFKC